MTSFRSDYKRSQPLLGTFFTISIARAQADEAQGPTTRAFAEARRLENIFSLRLPESELNLLNRAPANTPVEVSSELFYLLQLTEAIWRRSAGAFTPFFPASVGTTEKIFHYAIESGRFLIRKCGAHAATPLDLNGIAKGFIIDRAVDVLCRALPQASGVVNVGGDLRFFNTPKRCVSVRLGAPATKLARSLLADRDGIATSSPAVAATDPDSTTRYPAQLRSCLTIDHTAVAMASCTAIADSLTKVALFGSQETISSCALSFGARILVFDPDGRLAEEYGAA